MAHNLMIERDGVAMMYCGDPPWHRLGTKLDGPATAAEAIEAAGLDWAVSKIPLQAKQNGHTIPVPGKYATMRADRIGEKDCPVFGIVGKHYTPLQNREAFRFLDPIVGEGAAIYHTAGALGKGERIWLLAKLPGEIRVVGDDITEKFLLLSNSHDGTSAVQIKWTPIRVVCQNTLTLALHDGPTLRVPHVRDMQRRLDESREMLGLIHEGFEEIEASFKRMVQVKMNGEQVREYLVQVFPDPNDPLDEKKGLRAERNRMWAERFFDEGKGNQMEGVRGSLWAAYNGITELVDHRGYAGMSASRRLGSVWFGAGSRVKQRAYAAAVGLNTKRD